MRTPRGGLSEGPCAAGSQARSRVPFENMSTQCSYAVFEIVVKVYGPEVEEYDYLRDDLVLISFLSLPVNLDLMQALIDSRCIAFAMETIRDARGRLPVLTPMSEIAGRLTPQIGAHYLQRPFGGRGILLGGSTGVRPGRGLPDEGRKRDRRRGRGLRGVCGDLPPYHARRSYLRRVRGYPLLREE